MGSRGKKLEEGQGDLVITRVQMDTSIFGTECRLIGLRKDGLNGRLVRIKSLVVKDARIVVQDLSNTEKLLSVRQQNLNLDKDDRRSLVQLMVAFARYVDMLAKFRTATRPSTLDSGPCKLHNAAALMDMLDAVDAMLEACEPLDQVSARDPEHFVAFFADITRNIDAIVRNVEKDPPDNDITDERMRAFKFHEIVMNLVTSNEMNFCHAALMLVATNLPFTGLVGHVERRPSPIHGDGLFATVNIKAGEVITLYRCDTLIRKEAIGCCTPGDAAAVFKAHLTMPQIISRRQYGPNGEDYFTVNSEAAMENLKKQTNRMKCNIGDVEFRMDSDLDMPDVADSRGHLINAAGKDEMCASRAMNCVYMPLLGDCVIAAVAFVDIPAGQEILATYGFDYGWSLQ